MKKLSKLLKKSQRYSKPTLVVLIILVAIGGVYWVFRSTAASTPPPAGGYWPVSGILAPGSSFPTDAQCAAQVHRSPWEPRAANYDQNHFITPQPNTLGNFGIYTSTWNSTYKTRITGNFTGTTDEIFQWAACKWGWSDELIRAESVSESSWYEGERNASGQPINGHGFGDYEAKSSGHCPYALAFLNGSAMTTAAMPDPCPTSYGILQNRWYFHPQNFPTGPPPTPNSYPWTTVSTAFAVDEQLAELRGCYDGMSTFLGNTRGDLWGCIGVWFAGNWHSAAGDSYASGVQQHLANREWASWADQCAQTPAGCSTTGGSKTGDVNGDGSVNITDLSILASHYNQAGTAGNGDLNGDGLVSIIDLSILASHWGT